jgi:hypothetical protein
LPKEKNLTKKIIGFAKPINLNKNRFRFCQKKFNQKKIGFAKRKKFNQENI